MTVFLCLLAGAVITSAVMALAGWMGRRAVTPHGEPETDYTWEDWKMR